MCHCNKKLVLRILKYRHILFQGFQVLPQHQFSRLRDLVSVLDCFRVFANQQNEFHFQLSEQTLCVCVCFQFSMAPCPLNHASKGITGNAIGAETSCCGPAGIMSRVITIIYKDHSMLAGVVAAHQLDCARMFK